MRRIVYTITVGKKKYYEAAMGLGRSLKLIGDTTERVVVTDNTDLPWNECFDTILPPGGDGFDWLYFNKLDALKRTDADQILYIDSDTLAFKRLDDIFNFCQGHGLCVQGEIVSDGWWHIDVGRFCQQNGVAGIAAFNGGMIYYERTPDCERLISECYEVGKRAREFGFERTGLPINDEVGIAIAMALTGKGTLIPDVMDFQNSATGLIGKLHIDVRTNTCQFICRRSDVRIVEPYLFHASRYMNFFIYWRQLGYLDSFARFERSKPQGYMSPWHKIERSIQRRLLKFVFRKL